MPRAKSNAPRRLDESQQGEARNRLLPFVESTQSTLQLVTDDEIVTLSDEEDIDDEIITLSDEEGIEVVESCPDPPTTPVQEAPTLAEETDLDLFSQAPDEYFDLRRKTEIDDLEVRQIERERNELNFLRARLGDDLDGSADLLALKAQQSRRRELELEDLENQRNLDLDLRISPKVS
jgi:hypothetical protein